jgi:antitoxin component YwqK of YwqJK toxin-antitoxin module
VGESISPKMSRFPIKWFFMCIFSVYGCSIYSQLFHRPINQYNDSGRREGLWISYWDEEKKVPMSLAHYKNGYESGVSKEYHINGKLRLKFRYYKKRIRVKYYDAEAAGRKLEQKGWSIIEYNKEDIHYYWHGKWKFYDMNGKVSRIASFQFGEEVIPK